ncbi:TPA: hypothetical protein IVP45_002841, partial [Enterococcus faecium]|nr:hypothetical protein [Enterococcus faecium]
RSCENGENILKDMANIVNVTVESLETINTNSGGARWIINLPKANYWKKVYLDSNRLYRYLRGQKTNVQIWTAEMWAQLWNMMYFNIGPKVHEELNFCFATDPIEKFKEVKILHNAGVTTNDEDLFFKGRYVTSTPFDEDLSFVNKKKCSYAYAKAIKAVVR